MTQAQGALEYLLLLGGAILVAVIVIAVIVGITGPSEEETVLAVAHGLCAKFPVSECAGHLVEVRGQTFACDIAGTGCRATKGIELTSCGAPAGGWLDGRLYFLSGNLSGPAGTICFDMTANNVILNCNGKRIDTTGAFATVLVSGNGNTVKNCVIASLGGAGNVGIGVSGPNNKLIGNLIEQDSSRSIRIYAGGTNNALINNSTCGAGATQYIQISESGSSQAASSGNSCTTCSDAYADLGNPHNICVEAGALDTCLTSC
ncbi:MAG: right-handed parallel beta-helix repeat-containing protein [Candidatus Diapherotrites archaeon]|nr:right-handed parallel beta-helix repeat-containing protein [Candidatus Diapherotrites archaeon]